MKNTKWLMIGAVVVVGYLWWKNKSKKTTSETGTSTDTTDTSTDTTSASEDSATM